jgi:transcriptional accessory protein Tex/SPT6
MEKTIQELKDLFLEYKNSNDQNAYIAVEECIQIVLKNKGE